MVSLGIGLEKLFDRMCMALGGRVAESLTFNKITTGAQNDLQKVTQMAYGMVRQHGMSNTVGLVSFEDDKNSIRPYSKSFAALIDEETRRLITSAYQATEKVLKDNADKLQLLAETLVKKETLNYDDVVNLIGPPPHGNKKLIEPMEFEASVKQSNPENNSNNTNNL